MFSFFKKPPPPLCAGNPGTEIEARVAFSDGARSWAEKVHAVQLAEAALQARGYTLKNEKTCLRHAESEYILQPRLLDVQPLDNGGVRSTTTMQVNHPRWAPHGLFEYQHSFGESAVDAITKGFDQWAQVDFYTLLQALEPTAIPSMELGFPAKDGRPARTRRVILGPIMHFQSSPPESAPESPACPAPQDGTDNEGEEGEGEHPFCPCCLLTRSFEAFSELLQEEEFVGLRLFAARTEEGQTEADCRVNGEDFHIGMDALRKYAETWPAAGYEFRKQYVVLQTLPAKG